MIQHRGVPQILDYHVSAVQAELAVVSDEPAGAAGTLSTLCIWFDVKEKRSSELWSMESGEGDAVVLRS